MPLTNVSMWSKHGWQQITAREASKIHPGGTVSAKSGLFRCEICGQLVSLTEGRIRVRHFRHSSDEKSKDCPERIMGGATAVPFQTMEYSLPLRINLASRDCFELELGFLPIPERISGSCQEQRITIKAADSVAAPYIYSFDRLNHNSMTYLPIGNIPASKYYISVSGDYESLQQYWPAVVEGIDNMAMFDQASGKKMPYDADVQTGRKYYLLTNSKLIKLYQTIKVQEVCRAVWNMSYWYVYEVNALVFAEEAARFFLDYRCRLTDSPICLYPIWPVWVEASHLIYHKSKTLYMFFQGNAEVKSFPSDVLKKYDIKDVGLLEVDCEERQQLLSVGRTKVLEYVYVWKDSMEFALKMPVVQITDLSGAFLSSGIVYQLPKRRALVIRTQYDGELVISKGKHIQMRIGLKANRDIVVNDIDYGQQIKVFQGLDCIWMAEYQRKTHLVPDDVALFYKLNKYKGEMVRISHSIGGMAMYMDDYSQVKNWFYKAIRHGYIVKKALSLLEHYFYYKAGTMND